MGQERRRFIRVNARLTTFVKYLDTGKVRRVLTKNVGGVGICFVTDVQLASGTPLGLEIKLPDREAPIAFTGEVVWNQAIVRPSKSYEKPTVEVGVKFVDITPQDKALLQQHVSLNAPPPEPA